MGRAGAVGEEPTPNKKTNQRANTEAVQTDKSDLLCTPHRIYRRRKRNVSEEETTRVPSKVIFDTNGAES